MEIEKTLKKGANNAVYLVVHEGKRYAMRVPRQTSDTTKLSHATMGSLHHTALAASLKAAPTLYDAWSLQARDGQAARRALPHDGVLPLRL